MKCSNCGTEVSGGMFCPACGTRVDSAPAQSAGSYVPKHASPASSYQNYPSSMWDFDQPAASANGGSVCPGCGKPMVEGTTFCGSCGYRMAAPVNQNRPANNRKYSAPAKKSKLWVPIAAGVALILVIALVIGMISSMGGPLVKIGSAVKKTMKSGNFTVDYEVEVDGESIEGTAFVDIDMKERVINMSTTVEVDGAEVLFGIYDGYAFYMIEESGYSYSDAEDIEDELEEIFDAYEEADGSDLGEVLVQLDELMYDYAGEELSDYFDLEELEACLKAYSKAVAKEKWLKENLGYSKDKKSGETLYTFEPTISEFALASLPYFESAFEDSDVYDELMEALEDEGDELDDMIDMEYTIGVKSGYLSTIEMVIDADGEELEVTVKIYDVNKTKLDEAELADLLDDAS